MSAAATRPTPPPNAAPFTAAITGLGPCRIWRRIPTNGLPRDVSPIAPRFLRSAPAQNAGPSPVSTTARTAGSSIAAVIRAPRSATSAALSALRVCGDASVIHAADPRRSYRVTSSAMAASWEPESEPELLREIVEHRLVGPSADADQPGVDEGAARAALFHVAVPARELDAFVGHVPGDPRTEELRHRDHLRGVDAPVALANARVDQLSRRGELG